MAVEDAATAVMAVEDAATAVMAVEDAAIRVHCPGRTSNVAQSDSLPGSASNKASSCEPVVVPASTAFSRRMARTIGMMLYPFR